MNRSRGRNGAGGTDSWKAWKQASLEIGGALPGENQSLRRNPLSLLLRLILRYYAQF